MPSDDSIIDFNSYGGIGGGGGVGGTGKPKKTTIKNPNTPKKPNKNEVIMFQNPSKSTEFSKEGIITCFNKIIFPSDSKGIEIEINLNIGSDSITKKKSANYRYWDELSMDFPIKITKLKIYPENEKFARTIPMDTSNDIYNLKINYNMHVIKITSKNNKEAIYDLQISYQVTGLYSADIKLKQGISGE